MVRADMSRGRAIAALFTVVSSVLLFAVFFAASLGIKPVYAEPQTIAVCNQQKNAKGEFLNAGKECANKSGICTVKEGVLECSLQKASPEMSDPKLKEPTPAASAAIPTTSALPASSAEVEAARLEAEARLAELNPLRNPNYLEDAPVLRAEISNLEAQETAYKELERLAGDTTISEESRTEAIEEQKKALARLQTSFLTLNDQQFSLESSRPFDPATDVLPGSALDKPANPSSLYPVSPGGSTFESSPATGADTRPWFEKVWDSASRAYDSAFGGPSETLEDSKLVAARSAADELSRISREMAPYEALYKEAKDAVDKARADGVPESSPELDALKRAATEADRKAIEAQNELKTAAAVEDFGVACRATGESAIACGYKVSELMKGGPNPYPAVPTTAGNTSWFSTADVLDKMASVPETLASIPEKIQSGISDLYCSIGGCIALDGVPLTPAQIEANDLLARAAIATAGNPNDEHSSPLGTAHAYAVVFGSTDAAPPKTREEIGSALQSLLNDADTRDAVRKLIPAEGLSGQSIEQLQEILGKATAVKLEEVAKIAEAAYQSDARISPLDYGHALFTSETAADKVAAYNDTLKEAVTTVQQVNVLEQAAGVSLRDAIEAERIAAASPEQVRQMLQQGVDDSYDTADSIREEIEKLKLRAEAVGADTERLANESVDLQKKEAAALQAAKEGEGILEAIDRLPKDRDLILKALSGDGLTESARNVLRSQLLALADRTEALKDAESSYEDILARDTSEYGPSTLARHNTIVEQRWDDVVRTQAEVDRRLEHIGGIIGATPITPEMQAVISQLEAKTAVDAISQGLHFSQPIPETLDLFGKAAQVGVNLVADMPKFVFDSLAIIGGQPTSEQLLKMADQNPIENFLDRTFIPVTNIGLLAPNTFLGLGRLGSSLGEISSAGFVSRLGDAALGTELAGITRGGLGLDLSTVGALRAVEGSADVAGIAAREAAVAARTPEQVAAVTRYEEAVETFKDSTFTLKKAADGSFFNERGILEKNVSESLSKLYGTGLRPAEAGTYVPVTPRAPSSLAVSEPVVPRAASVLEEAPIVARPPVEPRPVLESPAGAILPETSVPNVRAMEPVAPSGAMGIIGDALRGTPLGRSAQTALLATHLFSVPDLGIVGARVVEATASNVLKTTTAIGDVVGGSVRSAVGPLGAFRSAPTFTRSAPAVSEIAPIGLAASTLERIRPIASLPGGLSSPLTTIGASMRVIDTASGILTSNGTQILTPTAEISIPDNVAAYVIPGEANAPSTIELAQTITGSKDAVIGPLDGETVAFAPPSGLTAQPEKTFLERVGETLTSLSPISPAEAAPRLSPAERRYLENSRQDVGVVQSGIASRYDLATKDASNPTDLTASGALLDARQFTVAMLGSASRYAWGTKLAIKNIRNGRVIVATVTNTGSQVGRHVDLSPAAANALGVSGVDRVEYAVVGVPSEVTAGYKKGRTDINQRPEILNTADFSSRVAASLPAKPSVVVASIPGAIPTSPVLVSGPTAGAVVEIKQDKDQITSIKVNGRDFLSIDPVKEAPLMKAAMTELTSRFKPTDFKAVDAPFLIAGQDYMTLTNRYLIRFANEYIASRVSVTPPGTPIAIDGIKYASLTNPNLVKFAHAVATPRIRSNLEARNYEVTIVSPPAGLTEYTSYRKVRSYEQNIQPVTTLVSHVTEGSMTSALDSAFKKRALTNTYNSAAVYAPNIGNRFYVIDGLPFANNVSGPGPSLGGTSRRKAEGVYNWNTTSIEIAAPNEAVVDASVANLGGANAVAAYALAFRDVFGVELKVVAHSDIDYRDVAGGPNSLEGAKGRDAAIAALKSSPAPIASVSTPAEAPTESDAPAAELPPSRGVTVSPRATGFTPTQLSAIKALFDKSLLRNAGSAGSVVADTVRPMSDGSIRVTRSADGQTSLFEIRPSAADPSVYEMYALEDGKITGTAIGDTRLAVAPNVTRETGSASVAVPASQSLTGALRTRPSASIEEALAQDIIRTAQENGEENVSTLAFLVGRDLMLTDAYKQMAQEFLDTKYKGNRRAASEAIGREVVGLWRSSSIKDVLTSPGSRTGTISGLDVAKAKLMDGYLRLSSKTDSGGDFTYKDFAAVVNANFDGRNWSLMDYVFQGVNEDFILRVADMMGKFENDPKIAGVSWAISAINRDKFAWKDATGSHVSYRPSPSGNAATAANSPHGRGLSADIFASASNNNARVFAWLEANARKFGLGRVNINGKRDQPHVQYVGIPATSAQRSAFDSLASEITEASRVASRPESSATAIPTSPSTRGIKIADATTVSPSNSAAEIARINAREVAARLEEETRKLEELRRAALIAQENSMRTGDKIASRDAELALSVQTAYKTQLDLIQKENEAKEAAAAALVAKAQKAADAAAAVAAARTEEKLKQDAAAAREAEMKAEAARQLAEQTAKAEEARRVAAAREAEEREATAQRQTEEAARIRAQQEASQAAESARQAELAQKAAEERRLAAERAHEEAKRKEEAAEAARVLAAKKALEAKISEEASVRAQESRTAEARKAQEAAAESLKAEQEAKRSAAENASAFAAQFKAVSEIKNQALALENVRTILTNAQTVKDPIKKLDALKSALKEIDTVIGFKGVEGVESRTARYLSNSAISEADRIAVKDSAAALVISAKELRGRISGFVALGDALLVFKKVGDEMASASGKKETGAIRIVNATLPKLETAARNVERQLSSNGIKTSALAGSIALMRADIAVLNNLIQVRSAGTRMTSASTAEGLKQRNQSLADAIGRLSASVRAVAENPRTSRARAEEIRSAASTMSRASRNMTVTVSSFASQGLIGQFFGQQSLKATLKSYGNQIVSSGQNLNIFMQRDLSTRGTNLKQDVDALLEDATTVFVSDLETIGEKLDTNGNSFKTALARTIVAAKVAETLKGVKLSDYIPEVGSVASLFGRSAVELQSGPVEITAEDRLTIIALPKPEITPGAVLQSTTDAAQTGFADAVAHLNGELGIPVTVAETAPKTPTSVASSGALPQIPRGSSGIIPNAVIAPGYVQTQRTSSIAPNPTIPFTGIQEPVLLDGSPPIPQTDVMVGGISEILKTPESGFSAIWAKALAVFGVTALNESDNEITYASEEGENGLMQVTALNVQGILGGQLTTKPVGLFSMIPTFSSDSTGISPLYASTDAPNPVATGPASCLDAKGAPSVCPGSAASPSDTSAVTPGKPSTATTKPPVGAPDTSPASTPGKTPPVKAAPETPESRDSRSGPGATQPAPGTGAQNGATPGSQSGGFDFGKILGALGQMIPSLFGQGGEEKKAADANNCLPVPEKPSANTCTNGMWLPVNGTGANANCTVSWNCVVSGTSTATTSATFSGEAIQSDAGAAITKISAEAPQSAVENADGSTRGTAYVPIPKPTITQTVTDALKALTSTVKETKPFGAAPLGELLTEPGVTKQSSVDLWQTFLSGLSRFLKTYAGEAQPPASQVFVSGDISGRDAGQTGPVNTDDFLTNVAKFLQSFFTPFGSI